MEKIQRWSGREARTLREAMRMSVRGFAGFLGVSERTISKWEEDGGVRVPNPESQALLDTALQRASAEVQERFQQAFLGTTSQRPTSQPLNHVPPLEPALIHRYDDFNSLIDLVIEAADADAISVVSIVGPGGFGKTTLATQAVHDDRIREMFPEIYWIETGQDCTPARLVELISDLCVHLDGHRPALHDPEQVGFHLARIMADRRILLIIDNVWSASDLSPFMLGAPECVRLVTTRNSRVCPASAREFRLGPMSTREITELIARNIPGVTLSDTGHLAELCGGWPLLATVVGANLNHDMRSGAVPHKAVTLAAEALLTGGPQAFDVWDTDQRKHAIGHAISASLQSLDDNVSIGGGGDLRAAYLSLAAFPASTPIPVAVLARWWQQSGWSLSAVRQFCRILADRSLIGAYLADRDAIILHDVFRSFLRHMAGEQWGDLHRSLTDAMRPSSGRWIDLDHENVYMWRHLSFHLMHAGEHDELVRLISSRDYAVEKTSVCGHSSLSADHQIARSLLDGIALPEPLLDLAKRGLTLTGAAYLLQGLTRANDMAVTLDAMLIRAGFSYDPKPAATSHGFRLLGATPPQDRAAGHIGAIVSVATQGTTLISGGEDGIVRIWDLDERVLVAELRGHTGWVYATAISPDGRTIVSAGEDCLIRIWDKHTASLVGALTGHSRRIRAVAFASDGRSLATGAEDGRIILWNLERQILQRQFTTPGTPIWSIAFTGGDDLLVSGGEDEYIRLHDSLTGALLDEQAGHRDWIRSIAASTAGVVVSGSGDRSARVWDTANRELVPRRHYLDLPDRVRAVAVGPDAGIVIAACEDATLHALSDVRAGVNTAMPIGVDWIRTIALTDAGDVVAGCEDGALRRWTPAETSSASLIAVGRNTTWSAAMSTHAGLTALGQGDGTIRLVHPSTQQLQRSLEAGQGRVWSLAAGGEFVAAACGDGTIRVWSTDAPQYTLALNSEMRRSWAVAVSSDGSLLAGSDHRGHVRVWQLPTGELLWDQDVKAGRLRSLAFDGLGERLAVCGGDGSVRLWDARTGVVIASIPNKASWARSVALDQNGSRVAIGTGTGGILIHDTADHHTLAELAGHTGRVLMLGFTDDPDRLVSAAADGTARLWSIPGQEELAQVRADTSGQCATFDPSTGTVVVAGAGGATYLKINNGLES